MTKVRLGVRLTAAHIAIVAMALAPRVALAQTSASPQDSSAAKTASPAQSPTLSPAATQAIDAVAPGDIIVTAQKRAERLQDVPLAVTAVTGDQLKTLGINDPRELRYVAPSLTYANSASTRGEGFRIRGVGTVVFSDSLEQSVGTVLDGVPLSRTGQAVADLVDIDHVEVIKGPQGMLFGKNASAGVVSITTKKPTFSNSLDAFASYGTYNEVKANATGNVKLSDDAAIRVSYARTNMDGFVHNIYRNEWLNGRDSQAVRAKLLVEPTSNFSIYLIGDWGRNNQLCCAWTARTAPLTTPFGQLVAASGITPGPDNLEMAADQPFYQKSTTWGGSLQMDLDAGWATLTSISAYRQWNESDNNDPDIEPINYLRVNSGTNDVKQYSQELRVTSPSGNRLEWVGGVFLYDWSTVGHQEQTGKIALPLPFELGTAIDSTVRNSGAAIFGQASYRLVDKLKLILGARYTDETVRMNFRQFAAPGAAASIPGRFVGTVIGSKPQTNLSGRATLQYSFDRDIMAYATVARGYKGPGFDTLGVVSSTATLVKPEIPTSYEIGLRTQLFNHTTIFNVTGFVTNFKNFQASIFDTDVDPARFVVTNAGLLKTRGIEAELQSQPLPGLSLSASASYINATFADFKNIACYPGQPVSPIGTPRTSPRQCIQITPTQSVTYADGLPLPDAPKFTYNATVGYERHVGDFVIDGQLNWFWRSKVNFDATGNPLVKGPAYGLLGANLGFGPESAKWRLSLFARNLLDKQFVNVIFVQPVLNAPGVSVQIPSPDARRRVGVSLEIKLGH